MRTRRIPVIALGCAALSVGLAGCVDTAPEQPTPTASEAATPSVSTEPSRDPVADELQDPLEAPDDPASPDHVPNRPDPVIHGSGYGDAEYDVTWPEGTSTSTITFYVACTPDAEYRIDAFGTFFTASCSADFANTGEVPVPAGDTAGTVSLTLPGDNNYVLVGLPNE
ncbi:hypothetical protein LG315_11975 [Microbacterium marinum]|uniref:hypothetical protein n=1 Tax=Microbacterium marinum TaxID=421115 RepID=UPI00384E18F7